MCAIQLEKKKKKRQRKGKFFLSSLEPNCPSFVFKQLQVFWHLDSGIHNSAPLPLFLGSSTFSLEQRIRSSASLILDGAG
jgi:hypothetical protein